MPGKNKQEPIPTIKSPFLGYEAEDQPTFGLSCRPSPPRAKRENVPVLHEGSSHLLTIGQTGSGKTKLLIANLLLCENSMIVIDVRGDTVRATEEFRRKKLGQKTYVLDPFNVTGRVSDRLDPLDVITLPNTEVESEAQAIASILLGEQRQKTNDAFWPIQAGNLISANVAHLLAQDDPQKRSMNCLIDALFTGDIAYAQAKLLDQEVAAGSFAATGMAAFLELPGENTANTRFCVASTAQASLQAFRSKAVRSTMGPSTVNLNDLLHGRPVTIYLVLPVEKLVSHAVVLRLWIDILLQVLLRRTTVPAAPTLIMADEVGQLGPCPALKTVATYLRASGVRLWTFWQDLAQIKELYPDWPVLVNNTSALTFMPGTPLAARELAAMAGVSAEQLASLTLDDQMVCETGRPPRIVKMARYWADSLFQGRYGTIPRFTVAPAR